MKGKILSKVLAGGTAFLIMSGAVPVQPFTQLFEKTAITVEAAETTVTYTFSKTYKGVNNLVFNGRQYLLNEIDSDGYGQLWQTATVNCGDVSVSISLSS